jgi:hypothetical protein
MTNSSDSKDQNGNSSFRYSGGSFAVLELLVSAVQFEPNWASGHDLEHDKEVGDYIFLSRISQMNFGQFTGLFSM